MLEGDEYDTAFFDKRSKFIHYLPDFVVVNNIEFDHADIFDDVEQIKKAFEYMLRVEVADLPAYKTFHTETLGTVPHVRSITSYMVMGSPKDVRA